MPNQAFFDEYVVVGAGWQKKQTRHVPLGVAFDVW